MDPHWIFALLVACSLAFGAGVIFPWRRLDASSTTPASVRGLLLAAVAAGIFVCFSGVAGLFYFFGGPTSPYVLLGLTALATATVIAFLIESR